MNADLRCASEVLQVTFSPNGSALATRDKIAITVWDLTDASALLRIPFESDFEQTLAYNQVGTLLAASRDALHPITRFWNATTGLAAHTLTGGYLLEFSPDGERVALLGRQGGLLEGPDLLVVYSVLTGAQEFEIGSTQTRNTKALGFTADFRLTTASPELAGVIVRRWDTFEGRLEHSMTVSDNLDFMNVDAIFAPGSATLAYRAWGRSGTIPTVRVIDLASGAEIMRLSNVPLGLFAAAFSGDGSRFAVAKSDAEIQAWRLPAGSSLGIVSGLPSPINALALSPDGLSLAVAGKDGTVSVRSLPEE